MRVLCENCGTTYKIPDSKLVREVNRATCRKCGYMMVIRTVPSTPSNRPAQHDAPGESEEERTLVTSLADVEKRAKEQAAAMEAQTARVDPVEGPEETETHEHTDAPMTFDPGAEPAFEEDLSDELSPDADIENDLPTMEEPTQAPDEPAPPPPPPAPKAPAKPAAKAAAPPKPVPNIASGKPAPKQPAQTRQTAAVKEPGTTTQPTLYGVPSPVQDAAQPSEASRQRQRSHDPSGDMTLVLMGTLLVIGGALILAFNAKGEPGIRFLGLLITLFGAFASFLVVATSNRGRKPASVVISLFLSVIGAVMTAGIAFVVVPAGDGPSLLTTLTQGLKMPTVATAPVSATPPVAEAPVAAAEAPVAAAEAPAAGADGVESSVEALLNSAATPETAPATTPVAAAPVAAAPVAAAPVAAAPVAAAPVATAPVAAAPTPAASTSSSKPATSSSGARTSAPSSSSSSSAPVASSSSARTSSTPSTSSSSRSATPSSTSSSTPSSSGSTSAATPATTAPKATLQPSVVDTMVRTNSGVKRCFAEEKSRNGALPARVDVKITILTSGKVNTAAIKGGDLAGTALDSCLSTAIKGIQFPPFDGDAVSLTYPFIFN